MKTRRKLSRLSIARRLHEVALRIAVGKPIRIGGVSVRVPDQAILEQEVEIEEGEIDLDFELKWPARSAPSYKKPKRPRSPKKRITDR